LATFLEIYGIVSGNLKEFIVEDLKKIQKLNVKSIAEAIIRCLSPSRLLKKKLWPVDVFNMIEARVDAKSCSEYDESQKT